MAKGPDSSRFRDSPVSIAFRTVDNKEQIDSILRAHDYGMFSQSATLVDEMMTDDRIQAVTNKRGDAIVACDVEFEAASDKPKAQEVRDLIGGVGDAHGLWRRMFPPAALKSMLRWGWYLCLAPAEIVWTYNKALDLQMPRLVAWHPTHVNWDWMTRRFVLRTESAFQLALPDLDANPRGDGKWFQWLPNGSQYGWRDGLVRSLAHKYIVRQWNDVDWARFNERHGTPIGKAKVPAQAGREEEESAFFERINNLGAETSLLLPQGDTPATSYDFEWAELQGRNWETFQALKKDLGDEIAVAVLGNNLTTQVDGGSLAASKVHEGVELRLLARDAEIAHAIYDQVLSWFCLYNFGDPELAPRMVIKVQPEKDEVAEVTKDETVTRVVLGAAMAGIPLDERAYAEKHGLPLLEEAEIEAEEAEEAEREEEPAEDEAAEGEDAAAALGLALKRYTFAGLPIAIENPVGSTRAWRDEDGTIGTTVMRFDYGYVEGHLSGDGEELDVYIGPDEAASKAYVVHQLKAPDFKRWDEDKVMLGFESESDARRAYLLHRSDGDRAIGGMTSMPLDVFKRKLKRRAGTGKIRASMAHDCGHDHAALKAKPKATRRDPAMLWNDQLERKGKADLARVIKGDLAIIQRAIASSKDFGDVKSKLTTLFSKTLKPDDMARLIERANVLAQLNGRLGATEDL